MAQANVDRDGVFKVVDGFELEQHTMSGWVLVETLRETMVDTGMDEVLHPQFMKHNFDNNSYYCGTEKVYLDRSHVVGRTRFLLRKDPDSVVAESVASVVEMEHRVAEAERKQLSAQERVGVVEGQLEGAGRQAARLNDRIERLSEDCKLASEQRLKMEADLAKVRQAIGEIKMSEILGADEG